MDDIRLVVDFVGVDYIVKTLSRGVVGVVTSLDSEGRVAESSSKKNFKEKGLI